MKSLATPICPLSFGPLCPSLEAIAQPGPQCQLEKPFPFLKLTIIAFGASGLALLARRHEWDAERCLKAILELGIRLSQTRLMAGLTRRLRWWRLWLPALELTLLSVEALLNPRTLVWQRLLGDIVMTGWSVLGVGQALLWASRRGLAPPYFRSRSARLATNYNLAMLSTIKALGLIAGELIDATVCLLKWGLGAVEFLESSDLRDVPSAWNCLHILLSTITATFFAQALLRNVEEVQQMYEIRLDDDDGNGDDDDDGDDDNDDDDDAAPDINLQSLAAFMFEGRAGFTFHHPHLLPDEAS